MTKPDDAKTGSLIQFPTRDDALATPTSTAVEPSDEPIDGEIVDEPVSRWVGIFRHVIKVPSTRTDRDGQYSVPRIPAPIRITIRTVWTIGHGHVSWVTRAIDAATHGHSREQMRLARLTGNLEALAEWTDRHNKLKDSRHKRLQNLPATVTSALQAGLMAGGVVLGLLIAGGLWVSLDPGGMGWGDWWSSVKTDMDFALTAIGILLQIALWLALPVLFIAAWREGRRAANPPRWMVSAEELAEYNSEITPDLITQALQHMKLPILTKFLDNGGVLEYVVSPREQGGGTYTQIRLPLGVTAAEFLPSTKVELLAGNLGRHQHETWPQRQPKADARVLDLWIADKGTMDKPAPPWPLLTSGEFDVFRDRLPLGVTMRSEQIAVGMLQKHWIVGGTSNQGKTGFLRLKALGLSLDVTVELHIADLKGDGDWSMFKPRAVTLIEGSSIDKVEATVKMLEWGVGEMARRYDAKQSQGIIGPISRELSRRPGSGFHPIWLFVDECQILYSAPHPFGGTKDDARAWRAAKRLHDQARAVNIHLSQGTQRPDDRTVPVQVREGAHVRCSLNVPNYETAKIILADAADRGARPQDLRQDLDAGTVVVTGAVEDIPKGQAFAIVKSHYVPTKQAYGVMDRAMKLMKRAGRVVGAVQDEPTEPADHLADVARVLGDAKRQQTHTVIKRLVELNADEYEDWTFADLKQALAEEGVTVRKTHGLMCVHTEDVATALRQRNGEGSDDAS